MSYRIRNYGQYRRGELGTEINDFTTTEELFSVNVVGDGYENFSQDIAEAFFWTSTNFVNDSSTEPRSPLVGQIWYDKPNRKLYVYSEEGVWDEVITKISSDGGLEENITSGDNKEYSLGSPSKYFNQGYIDNIYANEIIYENVNSSSNKNITITSEDNSLVPKKSNKYTSTDRLGVDETLADSLDDLITSSADVSRDVWKTKTEFITVTSGSNITRDLIEREHLIIILNSDSTGGNITYNVRDGVDSQLTVYSLSSALVNIQPNDIDIDTDINLLNVPDSFILSDTPLNMRIDEGQYYKLTILKTGIPNLTDAIISKSGEN